MERGGREKSKSNQERKNIWGENEEDNILNKKQNNGAHGASLLRRGTEMLTVFLGLLFGNSPVRWEARSFFFLGFRQVKQKGLYER